MLCVAWGLAFLVTYFQDKCRIPLIPDLTLNIYVYVQSVCVRACMRVFIKQKDETKMSQLFKTVPFLRQCKIDMGSILKSIVKYYIQKYFKIKISSNSSENNFML